MIGILVIVCGTLHLVGRLSVEGWVQMGDVRIAHLSVCFSGVCKWAMWLAEAARGM